MVLGKRRKMNVWEVIIPLFIESKITKDEFISEHQEVSRTSLDRNLEKYLKKEQMWKTSFSTEKFLSIISS